MALREFALRNVINQASDGSGSDSVYSPNVKTDRKWEITHLLCRDLDNACDWIKVWIEQAGENYLLCEQVDAAADTPYWYKEPFCVFSGERLFATFSGATALDRLELEYSGQVYITRG